MIATAYASQLPRLSMYDPGALGEGSLDPMGVAAIADRIAELLAPGLRARMSHPRFVTLSAIGAYVGMHHQDTVAADRTTTPDIAFEWMAVEALVRGPKGIDLVGLPGTQKARHALQVGERLSAGRYLRGPRVFGFTGVYRPFSLDAGVLEANGLPGPAAEELVLAWEAEQGMGGFLAGTADSLGAQLRQEAAKYVGLSLKLGESASPLSGSMSKHLARTLTPGGAGPRERAVLNRFVHSETHETRNALATLISADPATATAPEHEIAKRLLPESSGRVRRLLAAAVAYEQCTTLLTNTFRRLLRHGVVHDHGLIRNRASDDLPFADRATRELPGLVDQAVTTVDAVDQRLAADVQAALGPFATHRVSRDLVDDILTRHAAVQAGKGKRMWLEDVRDGWYVRPPFRDQLVPDDDVEWIHPMRLRTIADFLRATG